MHVAVPVNASGSPKYAANAEAELEQSRRLVEQLKKAGTLADLQDATTIPQAARAGATKKRTLEADEDEDDALPTSGTMADARAPVDTRGFFGKIFRRPPRRPVTASREIKKLGTARSQAATTRRDINPEGRRWAAGLGLVVAVGQSRLCSLRLFIGKLTLRG